MEEGLISYRFGDMALERRDENHVLVVTTNGAVKKNGECVMGAGIAKQVRDAVPGVAFRLGSLISEHGNRPFRLAPDIWSLPVKHHWAQAADPLLIATSLEKMVPMVAKFQPEVLRFPRPGSGNGKLDYFGHGIDLLMENFARQVSVLVEVWDFAR